MPRTREPGVKYLPSLKRLQKIKDEIKTLVLDASMIIKDLDEKEYEYAYIWILTILVSLDRTQKVYSGDIENFEDTIKNLRRMGFR